LGYRSEERKKLNGKKFGEELISYVTLTERGQLGKRNDFQRIHGHTDKVVS
jgi:hypothetical protein